MFSHHFNRHWCCIYVCFNLHARLEWRDRTYACHPGCCELSERSLQTLDSSHDDEPAGRGAPPKQNKISHGPQRKSSAREASNFAFLSAAVRRARQCERSEIERGRKQRRLRHAGERCLVRGSEGWRGSGPKWIHGYSRSSQNKVL